MRFQMSEAFGSEAIQKQFKSLSLSPGFPSAATQASYSMVTLPDIFSFLHKVSPLGDKISQVSPEKETL